MKDLIIVGAGGFGRELVQWIEDINLVNPEWKIVGFLDDNPDALKDLNCDYAIVGDIKNHKPSLGCFYACAISKPAIKEKVVSALKGKGARFASIIHPLAVVGSKNSIGEGFVAYPHSCVSTNVKIGNFVTLLMSGVGHDVEIGDFSTISSFCDVTGGVKIGSRAFLASHVSIIPGKKIGDDAFVGVGSVVVTNIKAGVRVFGNPARKMPI